MVYRLVRSNRAVPDKLFETVLPNRFFATARDACDAADATQRAEQARENKTARRLGRPGRKVYIRVVGA